MADAKLWNIASPQRLEVVSQTYFTSPVTTFNHFSITQTELYLVFNAAPTQKAWVPSSTGAQFTSDLKKSPKFSLSSS